MESHSPHEQIEFPSDEELIQACLEGDEQAWELLVQRYARLIYTIPLRFGFSQAVADEIFQEVCLTLLEKLDTLRDHTRLDSWLMTVTRRACIRRWRRKVEFVELEPHHMGAETANLPEDDLIWREEQLLVREALSRLNQRCRELLTALFFQDPPPTYQEIADRLGLPVGSIGPTRIRCLEKLRRVFLMLEQRGIEGDEGGG